MKLVTGKCHKISLLSTLVQVMACCCQARSYYLSQCWTWSSKLEWLETWYTTLSRDAVIFITLVLHNLLSFMLQTVSKHTSRLIVGRRLVQLPWCDKPCHNWSYSCHQTDISAHRNWWFMSMAFRWSTTWTQRIWSQGRAVSSWNISRSKLYISMFGMETLSCWLVPLVWTYK